jgi:hypothetical protein
MLNTNINKGNYSSTSTLENSENSDEFKSKSNKLLNIEKIELLKDLLEKDLNNKSKPLETPRFEEDLTAIEEKSKENDEAQSNSKKSFKRNNSIDSKFYFMNSNQKIINEKTNEKTENVKNKNQNNINEGIEFKTIIKNMEKFYLCNYKGCSNLYRSKENLVLHYKNKHLKEKPYRCSFCKATFSHRNGKTYHERKVHTLIFPHKCSFLNCDMKFASKSALNYHLKHQH